MRILGIDHGSARIGLAISDELGLSAHGLPTLRCREEAEALAQIGRVVAERGVEEIVIGLPRNMDGSLGPQAQKAMGFAEKLKGLGKPVHFVDERLTTERAQRVMADAGMSFAQRRKNVDRMAAQFILQIHLDRRRSGVPPEPPGE